MGRKMLEGEKEEVIELVRTLHFTYAKAHKLPAELVHAVRARLRHMSADAVLFFYQALRSKPSGLVKELLGED